MLCNDDADQVYMPARVINEYFYVTPWKLFP